MDDNMPERIDTTARLTGIFALSCNRAPTQPQTPRKSGSLELSAPFNKSVYTCYAHDIFTVAPYHQDIAHDDEYLDPLAMALHRCCSATSAHRCLCPFCRGRLHHLTWIIRDTIRISHSARALQPSRLCNHTPRSYQDAPTLLDHSGSSVGLASKPQEPGHDAGYPHDALSTRTLMRKHSRHHNTAINFINRGR